MAAIGDAWVDGAWEEAGWVAEAWEGGGGDGTGKISNIASKYTRPWYISIWILLSQIFTNG